VTTHAHGKLLQKVRARQQTQEFRDLYSTRSKVECKITELAGHGIQETRYLGGNKRQLQRLSTGAADDLKHLYSPWLKTRGAIWQQFLLYHNTLWGPQWSHNTGEHGKAVTKAFHHWPTIRPPFQGRQPKYLSWPSPSQASICVA